MRATATIGPLTSLATLLGAFLLGPVLAVADIRANAVRRVALTNSEVTVTVNLGGASREVEIAILAARVDADNERWSATGCLDHLRRVRSGSSLI